MIKKLFIIASFTLLCLEDFLYSPLAAEQFPFLAEAIENHVNVRAGQNKNFEKVGSLQKGEEVVVVNRSYDWYQIKLPIQSSLYTNSKFVELLGENVGKIIGHHVNVRAKPDLRASSLGQLARDTLVTISKCEKDWCSIEPTDETYGWVLVEFLKFKSKSIPPPRIVLPPTKNIYEIKRRQLAEQAQREQEALVRKKDETHLATVGVVESLGPKAVSENIRHQLVVDPQTKFYLLGYRSIIDGFLNLKVDVEGEIQKALGGEIPVLLVTKINLVL